MTLFLEDRFPFLHTSYFSSVRVHLPTVSAPGAREHTGVGPNGHSGPPIRSMDLLQRRLQGTPFPATLSLHCCWKLSCSTISIQLADALPESSDVEIGHEHVNYTVLEQ